ncbi:hypothetical protein ABOM_009623 [Aspergillus bombycis]|uniref:Major facilitator superfamily (MFS) profile domain-containing protein n=1 Tax=Aspergillus bombycis TaxID=109264 RepID=A0A1F7ZQV1_9EURO|nr:hypothetical protein ABOM_009623 [Aspergillus bombycis]OGM41812.1 hypothetical protein ABOM_009623 [Aspergillus bombycis]
MSHFVPRHSRDEEDRMIPLPSVQFYTEYDSRYDIPVPAVRLSSDSYQRHGSPSNGTQVDFESDQDRGKSGGEPNPDSHDSQQSRLLFADQDSLVTWSGPDDPSNPLNWSRPRKWISTLLVSCFTFISPVSSTMVAPALSTMADEFEIQSDIKQYLLMSIFLLAYALGPFIIAPLSEMYGRVVVLQSANMFYLVFNTVCGFATSGNQMLAFRFLSGFGGSAPQAACTQIDIGGGVLSDCWRKEERGAATALYSLMPFIGPAIGPIVSVMAMDLLGCIHGRCLVQLLAFLFLRETYAPKILATRKRKLQELTGNHQLHTEYDRPDRTFGQVLRKNLIRPFRMLFTQPAIQALSLYRGYQYGLMYLVLASFPLVWEGVYSQAKDIASLNYISLGVGFVIGLQFCGRVVDIIYVHLQRRYDHPGRPEFRIPLMLPGGLLVPIGLFIYGWSAEYHTHWIIPNIGAAIFAIGLIISFQCAQTYVVDAYSRYAASATGAAAFVRTLAGFAFPLFAESLYRALGLGWGNSLLAFVSLALGIVAPLMLWYYGEWLRAKSPYCAG